MEDAPLQTDEISTTHTPKATGTLVLIAILTVIVFASQHFLPEPAVESDDENRRFGDTATQLELMAQGKFLVAMVAAEADQETDNKIQESIAALAPEPMDGAAARALAALHFFANPLDSESALSQLDKADDLLPEEERIHTLVRREITSPGNLTEKEQQILRHQMHWFAGPLLLASEPDDNPQRIKLVQQVGVLLLFVSIAGFALAAGFFIGLVLLILAFTRHQRGENPFRFEPSSGTKVHLRVFLTYLSIMALPVIFYLTGSVPEALPPATFILSISTALAVAIAFLPGTFRERLRSLGLHRGRGVVRELCCGIVGYCCVLPIAAVGVGCTVILWQLMELLPAEAEQSSTAGHPIGEMFFNAPLEFRIGLLLLAAVVAPLIEETMFRGALHRGLRRYLAFAPSMMIGGLIFAAVHPQGFVAIPVLTALAIGFALIREWRDSLIAPMVAHGVHNGLLVSALWIATL